MRAICTVVQSGLAPSCSETAVCAQLSDIKRLCHSVGTVQ